MKLENRLRWPRKTNIIGPYRPPRGQKFDCVRQSDYSLFKATIEGHSKMFRVRPLFSTIDMRKMSHIWKSKLWIQALIQFSTKVSLGRRLSIKSQISHTRSLLNTSYFNYFGVAYRITQKRGQKMDDGKVLSRLTGLNLLPSYK